MTRWKHDSVLHMPDQHSDNNITVGREVPKAVVLENIGRASMRIFHAAYCMLAYLDHDEKHFIALGFESGEESKLTNLPEGIGLLGQLWQPGQATIRLDNIATHRQSSGCPHGHPVLEAFLGAQICFDDQILGVIYLSKRPGDSPFAPDDEATLEVLASACAIELANAQTFGQLKDAYADLELRTEQLNQANAQLQAHERELETSAKALSRANKQLKVHAIDLELLNEDLMLANRAKDQFLANTSHELRTPLNAIIGFSDLLSDARLGELNDKQQRYIGHISVSGKRLLNIINALLDISKIESGMMEIHESAFTPVDIGQQLMLELRPLADQKNIQLMLNHSITEDTSIQSDKDKVHQMLVNLLGNAIKFTPDGGKVELNMSLTKTEGSDDEYTFCCCVQDNGIGIATADQEKIFTPFVQACDGVARSHDGTGLGLSLAKHMAELLGGSIHLESIVQQGSRFSITLPVLMNHTSDQPDISGTALLATEEKHAEIKDLLPDHMPQPVIMIVDEDKARASAVQRMFDDEGYRVIMADFNNANDKIAHNNPLLIVLGVENDSSSIYERLQRLKHLDVTNRTPTILLAGDADHFNFSTGATIGQIKDGMDHQELLEMVSHFGIHAPKLSTAPMVLVVDDDLSVREYLKETLAAEGYHVLLADNGDEGVKIAIERDPDLIILDLMMPGTSGFEVINRLREHPSASDIPVVIFTAKDLTRSEALLLGKDVERILVKGVSSRRDVLQQLRKLELLYPVRAKLMDTKLDCFNFRYMQRRLEHEMARSTRYQQHFSLLAWEMDGFDRYCKKHGKRWGQAALKASISIVHSIIRKGDVLARLDNNRLMLLLPGLSISKGHFVAEKIRLRISRQSLPLPNNKQGKMTVSIGGVASSESEDSQDIIALLQQRVASASAEGGNRMILEDA